MTKSDVDGRGENLADELKSRCRSLEAQNEDLSLRLAEAIRSLSPDAPVVASVPMSPKPMDLVRLEEGDDELSQELHLGGGVQSVLDSLPFYVLLIDEDHRIVLANKVFRDGFGMSNEQLCGAFCPQLVHDQDGPIDDCPVEQAAETGQGVQVEYFDRRFQRWFLGGAYPLAYRTAAGKRVFFHFVMDISERKCAEQEAVWGRQTHEALADLLRLSFSREPLESILQEALLRLLRLDWLALSPKGAIFLANTDAEMLFMVASSGLAEPLLEECGEVAFGHCLCGRAAKFGNLVFANKIDSRHDTTYDGIVEHGHYCLPILDESTVLGVLNLYVNPGHVQDAREEGFLRSACDVLSGIIRHRRAEGEVEATADRLRDNLDGTVKAMAVALEARDPYTAGHMERVTNLAVALGQQMNLPEETIETIRLAAGMHDIGKLQVPAEILSKPGRLNEHEFALIKSHSAVGYVILKDIDFAAPVATIVLQHHEKLDGSGYPHGLKGEAILLESRILAVSDVVEAVASHRPYRPALGVDKALSILQEGSGTHFDPAVVAACLELFSEGYAF